MNNKVYYGEYSLEYWIKLLISSNIVLPPYQRSLVWKESEVKDLVKTIKANRFVPPITVGSYTQSDGAHMNYIVDGQQRLTSILLAAIGYFPDVKKWESDRLVPAADDDDDRANGEDDIADNGERRALKWTYKELIGHGPKTLMDVKAHCASQMDWYSPIPEADMLCEDDLKKRYIGFCYLIPDTAGSAKNYYADVFMDINGHGVGLSDLETRRSLYFLHDGLDRLIEPEFLDEYGLVSSITKKSDGTSKITERIDFIKYLSIMDDYLKMTKGEIQDERRVAIRYKNDPQSYYKEFILVITGRDINNKRFCTQDSWAYKRDYKKTIEAFKEAINTMDVPRTYDSIADMDVAFFGLVYWICYCGKKLDGGKKAVFKEKLNAIFSSFRNGEHPDYLKSASQVGKMRNRITKSVELYREFLTNA